MKRFAASAGMIVIAVLGLVAAVWDGSAVAGVAGDFPGDGLYGACNSFPRDTSVTVTNLENGKSVMVTVTNGVENPGVFIALSPKAAAELGMRSGTTARIRAVAITASQAEMSLPPPARAGETADPDFNPKVYVERDKAAVKAAAASAAAPTMAAAAVEAAPAVTENPETALGSTTATQPDTSSENPPAKDIAKVSEPQKELAPALPSPSEAAPESPADSLSVPASPKPTPLGMSLPSPDLPSIPEASAPTPREGYLTLQPEILGGSMPQPRKAATPRVAMSDPTLPATLSAQVIKVENASVDAFSRPAASAPESAVALSEPTLAPDVLPEAILNRIIAPSKISPIPVLADAEVPKDASEKAEFEIIALERPSYADQVEVAALADVSTVAPSEAYSADRPDKTGAEEVSTELAEAELPGSPDAFGEAKPAMAAATSSEIQEPDIPRPSESLVAGSPNAVEQGQVVAELAEPATTATAVAVAAEKPTVAASPSAELASPEVPSPSESVAAERPVLPAAGEPTVALEPAAPRPPQAAVVAEAEPNKAPPAAVATVKGSKPSGVAQPPASIPLLKGLAKGSFYVQIGVYGTNDALQSAIGGFKSTYPLAVESLTTKAGSLAFRLFVGPLTRDESGAVLFKIRSLGYKDAYVRKGS